MSDDLTVEQRIERLESDLALLTTAVLRLSTAMVQVAGGRTPQQTIDPDTEVELVGGRRIKVKDVPIDPKTGGPEESWALVNCPCPAHEEARKQQSAPPAPTGQYL